MMCYEELQKQHQRYGGQEHSDTHSDNLTLELNQLQNLVKGKDKDLRDLQTQIQALNANEGLKDKAIEELQIEASKLTEKLKVSENIQELKDVEIKKLTEEKNDALTAQYAAEAALRKLHMNQKDDEPLHLESFIAPLEAEIKMCKNEIAALVEDKKALERLTKSKESALIEAERILRSALERALIVEEVQNQNFDLKRQIEICQEENKILEKTNRQKVQEVEKLSQSIQELEEAILASGAAANAVRDYQRQISHLMEEKRTLEREKARLKVMANRVANVVANEWKDENDKVIPVKQWLEERKLLQAEMQRLRDKLAVSERTAKAEAQLKDKLKLRLNTLEEGLKHASCHSINQNPSNEARKAEKSNILGFLSSNNGLKKRSTSQPRSSTMRNSILLQPNLKNETSIVAGDVNRGGSNSRKKFDSGETILRKGIWASRSKVLDSGEKENEMQANVDVNVKRENNDTAEADQTKGKTETENDSLDDGMVSGFLYDRLQKEVIHLRKTCEMKEGNLHAKDEEIKMLMKKIYALTKSIEVESKKMKREAAAREKEAASTKADDVRKNRSTSARRATKVH